MADALGRRFTCDGRVASPRGSAILPHLMRRLAPLLVVACSDYALETSKTPAEGGLPTIAVDPGQIDITGVCSTEARDILIENQGDATLTLSAISIDGDGWDLVASPSLPHTLGIGESTLVSVEGSDGDAALIIDSDDLDTPRLQVPLSAIANTPPVVRIDSPTSAQVIAENADLALLGYVHDDEQGAETLGITWAASIDGVVSTAGALADGTAAATWVAAGRTAGAQRLDLSATDDCGLATTASADFCQEGASTYDALSLAAWHYEGAAYWDSGNTWIELTPAVTDQVGSAFETSTPVNADDVQIEFYFYIGDGSGADGISLTALDTARMTSYLGGTGCGIGYGGSADCTSGPALPGWSLEIDTYYNSGVDPTGDDHLAFTFDGDVDGYVAWATLPEMENTGWHLATVRILSPRLTVAIDGTTYIDQDVAGNFAFNAFVGFTAGTGGDTNRHLIDELTITDYRCD